MKELLQEFRQHEVEIVSEQQQRKEIRFLANQRRIRGHSLWSYNRLTHELKQAGFKKENVMISSLSMNPQSVSKHDKVVIEKDCTYFQALNRKNAEKIIKRNGLEIKRVDP